MQVIIGNTDLTRFVQEKSYKIESIDDFVEWKDAGKHLHRGGYSSKVQGSFEMVFFDGYTVGGVVQDNFGDVLQLIEDNSNDKVLTIKLTVNNLNNMLKEIYCYCDIQTNSVRYTNNGSDVVVKRMIFNIEER
jgi:hypothetical protein